MNKIVVSSKNAPKTASFFSQAVLTNNKYRLEISGQIGMDPQTKKLVKGGVNTQTEQIFNNIEAILSELGWTFENITKTRIFLTSMTDYEEMNAIYAKKFGETPPSRITVAVKELPLRALIEIECIAEGSRIPETFRTNYD